MNLCQNPECGKEIPEGKAFCDGNCLRTGLELKKSSNISLDSTIETTLIYMGIDRENFSKVIAYNHWARFLQFVKENSGQDWITFIRPRLRSYIGVDYRYLDAYLSSALIWHTMELRDGKLYFLGVPTAHA